MEPENQTPKPRRSLFGCLFSGGLGCGAFLFGAVLSVALFAPTMLGDVVARSVQGGFRQKHDGRLMIEDLQLSWADRQRATGVKVLDRDGEEVLVFNARSPSLLTMLGLQEGAYAWEVEILRARLEIDSDGVTNLEHALADRGRAFDWVEAVDSALIRERPTDWLPSEGFASGEWAWTSFKMRATAGVISISDARQALDAVSIEELDLEILAGPGGESATEDRALVKGRLNFPDGGSCSVDLSRPLAGREWSGLVEGQGLPTRLIGSMLGDGGRLDTLLGAHCGGGLSFAPAHAVREPGSARADRDGSGPGDRSDARGPVRVQGELTAAPSTVQWSFFIDGDEVRSTAGEVALRVLAPVGGVLSSEAIQWLFPWLAPPSEGGASQGAAGEVTEAPRSAGVQVDVETASLSLRSGLSSLDGTAVVTLGEPAYAPIRAFADTLGLSGNLPFELDASTPIALQIEGGVLLYDAVAMSIDQQRCSFSGKHFIETGRIEVEVEVPLGFVGRRLLDPGALDQLVTPGVTVPVQLIGTWRAPNLIVNLRVLQEAMSLNFKSAVQNKAVDVLSKTLEALIPSEE